MTVWNDCCAIWPRDYPLIMGITVIFGRRSTSLGQQRQIYRKLQELFTEDVPDHSFTRSSCGPMSATLRNMSPLGIRDALLYSHKWYFTK